jgi:hypothetical protein
VYYVNTSVGINIITEIMGDIQSNLGSKASTPSEEESPILSQKKVCKKKN